MSEEFNHWVRVGQNVG